MLHSVLSTATAAAVTATLQSATTLTVQSTNILKEKIVRNEKHFGVIAVQLVVFVCWNWKQCQRRQTTQYNNQQQDQLEEFVIKML